MVKFSYSATRRKFSTIVRFDVNLYYYSGFFCMYCRHIIKQYLLEGVKDDWIVSFQTGRGDSYGINRSDG